jgi:RHS repeat-associated protein
MRLNPSSFRSYLLSYIVRLPRMLLRHGLTRKLLCLAIIINLLIWPSSGIALRELPVLAATAIEATTDSLGSIPNFFKWLFGSQSAAVRQETLADRNARVAQIRISPHKFVGYLGETATLTSLGADSSGQTVQGVKFDWESSDTDKLQIDDAGRATFLNPGLARVTCRTGSASATIPVLIRPRRRPIQTDPEWRADQDSLTDDGQTTGHLTLPSLLDGLTPTAHAQGGYGDDFPSDGVVYGIGTPPHTALEQTRLGPVVPGYNFEFAVPVANLGGRGLAANLMLYYNSSLWTSRLNPSTNEHIWTFDPIKSWPSPGFSLGFGRIVWYDLGYDPGTGQSTWKYMLIDPNGTRRSLGVGSATGNNTLKTTDGTNITFVGNVAVGGTLYYNDGTAMTIGKVNNRLLPTQITDTNGNYIQIAYKTPDSCTPAIAINYIIDTLGRYIQFNYDCLKGGLYEVVAPGGGMQIDYQAISFQPNFVDSSGQPSQMENTPSTLSPIRHIYVPTAQKGYLLSYSQWGMVYDVSLRKGMSGGWIITDGTEAARATFNYPTTSLDPRTTAPTFTQRVESPGGTYSYTQTDGIVRPDGSKFFLTGLDTEIKTSTNVSMGRTVHTFVNDPGGSQQVQSVTAYDDTGTATKVDFDYDQYGNVTNKREYGEKIGGVWKVRRRTHYTYLTTQAYLDAYIRNRPLQVEVLDALENISDGDDVLIGKQAYGYDNYSAMGGMEVYSGSTLPPGHLSSYDATKTTRGNLTGVTKWKVIATNETETHNSKLDRFGNPVKVQVSCCQEKSFTYGQNTYWARAEQTTSGNPSGDHLTTTAGYNFSTLTVASQTDPNNQTTSFSYDTLRRPTGSTSPTGATSTITYNDTAQTVTSTVSFTENGNNKTATETQVYDGWGQMSQSVNVHGGQVNLTYDQMGRLQAQTNPFQQGGQPSPATSYQYDALGRTKVATLPDSNTVLTDCSGRTVTITDQVGRKIKRETDSLGRLVKVTEQDATGALTLETTYTYDIADRLVGVNQGGQTRAYKYDDEGKLLLERIPEQTATINDGTGTYWTTKYAYTSFGALQTRTDARGVVTTYGYDNLNRLTSISYDTTNAPGVAATNNVTYTYDNNQSSSTKGLLLSITMLSGTQATYTETLSYDSNKRVASRMWTRDGLSYTTGYQYNTANQLTQITYPVSLRVLNINHDDKGRLSSIADQYRTYLSNLVFNPAGQVSSHSYGNGVAESFTYNNRMQVSTQTATVGGNTRMGLTYDYQAQAGQSGVGTTAGNSGQLMAVNNNSTIGGTAESASFTYDLQGRLVTSNQTTNGASAQRRFSYDRWGNRTGMWDAVSGGNQIQSITLQQSGGAPTNRIQSVTSGSTLNYSYDAAGNVLSDGVHTYTYDAENRLRSADWGASNQAAYIYDYASRRIKKFTNAGVTYYVWEGSQVIGEYSSTGGVIANYVYGSGRMVSRLANGVVRYYLSDRLSVRMMLDASGSVVGRQGHLPYGEEIGTSGEFDKKRFTSYERDGESGLDYAVNRSYSPTVGRFLQADPYRESGGATSPQSWNRYSYVQNMPVDAVDPLGLILDTTWGSNELCDGSVVGQLFCSVVTAPSPRDPTPEPLPAPATCIIHASFWGPVTQDVPLRYPDDSQNRGPTTTDPRVYAAWNMEISFSVSDNVANWTIDQAAIATYSGLWKVNGNIQEFSGTESRPDDRPADSSTWPRANSMAGYKWRFWIDSPGASIRGSGVSPWTGTWTFQAVSLVTNGRTTCSRRWHIVLNFIEGELDREHSNAWEDL